MAAQIWEMNHGKIASWWTGKERAYARREGLRPTITQSAGNSRGLGVGQNGPISGPPLQLFATQTFTNEKVDLYRIIKIPWLSGIADPG
jgi:hypothetical protein